MAINQSPVLIYNQDLGYNIVANILQGDSLDFTIKGLPPTTGTPYSYDWFMQADVPYVGGVKYWTTGTLIQGFSGTLFTNDQSDLSFSAPIPIGVASFAPGQVFSFTFQLRKYGNAIVGVEVVFFVEGVSSNPENDGLIITPQLIYEKLINKVTTFSGANDTTYPTSKLVKDNLDLKANISSLSAVATSGSYNDLFNKPTTTGITEGTNLYFTSNRVLNTILTGVSAVTNTAINTADTILQGLGKAQGQINSILSRTTDAWNEGSINLYFTVGRVLGTALTGLSTATSAAITSTDSVLSGFGKLQAQINNIGTTVTGLTTSIIAEGSNLYFTTARVLNTALTGFSSNNAVIAATDTTVAAFGKAQGQISAIAARTTDQWTEGTTNLYFTVTRVLNTVLTGFSANNAVITATDTIQGAISKAQGQISAIAARTTTNWPEGTNLYFTVARVLATALTGFSTATSTVVTATDTILVSIGKLQAQISAYLVLLKTNPQYIIAAFDAPTWWKNRADVICDQVDDDVEFNAARALLVASTKGGVILGSPGKYNWSSAVIASDFSQLQTPSVTFQGSGSHSSYIRVPTGVNGFEFGKSSQMNIIGWGGLLSGTANFISQGTENTSSDFAWRMKDNLISDIAFAGDSTHTGWGINIQPFRTKIERIFGGALFNFGSDQIYANPANGMKLYCGATPGAAGFNNGDSYVNRVNISIKGTADGQIAMQLLSPQASLADLSGFNQVVYDQVVLKDSNLGAFATIGIKFGEAGGDKVGAHNFSGINAEEFRTVWEFNNTQQVEIDAHYNRSAGAGAATNWIVRCMDSGCKNIHFKSAAGWGIFGNTTIAIEDANTDAGNPNIYENINLQTSGGNAYINGTLSSTPPAGVIIRNINGLQRTGNRHPLFSTPQGIGGQPTYTDGQLNIGGYGNSKGNLLTLNRYDGTISSILRFGESTSSTTNPNAYTLYWDLGVIAGSTDFVFNPNTAGSQPIRINKNGNVGFGGDWSTGTPQFPGDVKGDLNFTGVLRYLGTQITTTIINEGTNLYFTVARVLATALTGLSLASGGVIAATDTILQALGKLQYQITNLTTSAVTEGSNLYFTTARVLNTALTGFSSNNAVIAATDTILQGFNKLQGQITGLTTTVVTEGTNLYFTVTRVLGTVLTGLSLATNAAITATDTALIAFGKLQKQITEIPNTAYTWTVAQTYSAASSLIFTARTGTTTEGQIFFQSVVKRIEITLGGVRQFFVGTGFIQTNTITVNNITIETDLIGSGVSVQSNRTIFANTAVVGNTIEMRFNGHANTQATPGTLTLRLKVGAFTIPGDIIITDLPANQSNQTWELDANMTFRVIGASGSISVGGSIKFYVVATKTWKVYPLYSTGNATVDTTVDNQIQFTAQWSVANATDLIASRNGNIKFI